MVLERLMQMEEEPILYYIWQKISYIRKSEFEEKVKFSRSSLYKPIYEFLSRIKRVRWNFLPDYVEWLLNNNVSFKKWEDYKIYQQFVKHKINSELPREAIERSLVYIDSVGKLGKYFKTESIASFFISLETGTISPWLVLLYDKNDDMFSRMDLAQLHKFQQLVNVPTWQVKIDRLKKTVASLKKELMDFEI